LFQREPSANEVQRGLGFLKKAEALYASAAAEPQPVPVAETAPAAARRRGAAAVVAGEEGEAPAAAPAFPAGRMTPWQQYAQALLSAGEFMYVN